MADITLLSSDCRGYDNLVCESGKSTLVYVKPIITESDDIFELLPETETSEHKPVELDDSKDCRSTSEESLEKIDLPSEEVPRPRVIQDEEKKLLKKDFRRRCSVNVFEDLVTASTLLAEPNPSIQLIDPISNKLQFIFSPPPPGVVIKCQLHKTNRKDKTNLFTNFHFSLETSDRHEDGSRDLLTLMVARNRKKSKTANYVIGTDPENIRSRNSNTVGKLRGNFMGSRFRMYQKIKQEKVSCSPEDPGEDDEEEDEKSMEKFFTEMGVLFFKQSFKQTSKPRSVGIAIPLWDSASLSYDSESHLPSDIKELQPDSNETPKFVPMANLPPVYNPKEKCYALDFGGRVKEVSVKNFALMIKVNGKDKRVFQFGKTGDHFITDYTYPLCAFQAFCLGLSTCHHKFSTD